MLALVVNQMQFLIREVWVHPLNTTRMGKGEFYTNLITYYTNRTKAIEARYEL